MDHFVGVDVGTGSARAALVTASGEVVGCETCPIRTWTDGEGFIEQSSEDIWTSVCTCVKRVSQAVTPDQVKGIGFDATCSLVAIDTNNRPITISRTGRCDRNVILWMDHRAEKQANFINSLEPPPAVLKYVGGKISLEMETPKLMWIKENLPDTWKNAKYFFDLPDYLTWKATGDDTRSLCSAVCKWTYMAGSDSSPGWNHDYFKQIGLEQLLENNAIKIGSYVSSPGASCGTGLSPEAAAYLGLHPGTPVGASIIDAHAGGLGLLGCTAPGISSDFDTRIGLICGTSTCHMAVANKELFVPGVWGPYYNAMIPGMWLSEAGQSATGKLLDHIVDGHPATAAIKKELEELHIHQYLNNVLKKMAETKKLSSPASLTRRLYIYPDFHGNRSPIADPTLLGMICGLTLASGEQDLAVKYLATIQALAYGTKHILETLRENGHDKLQTVLLCGGLSKNTLFVQTHADVLGMPVLLPREPESVLLGAAMLAAVAGDKYKTVEAAVAGMGGKADIVQPNTQDFEYHEKKYKVFRRMVDDQKAYESLMN